MPKRKSKTEPKKSTSGLNLMPRMTLRAARETQFAEWEECARDLGLDLTNFIREASDARMYQARAQKNKSK